MFDAELGYKNNIAVSEAMLRMRTSEFFIQSIK